jgi:Tfp pilus assembly protein PilZ
MLMPSANGAFDNTGHLRDQGASVRVPFVHGCLLTTRSRTRGGLVCNLSMLGVYVTMDEPLPERGDPVHLLVSRPGESPLLEAETVVTWQNRTPASGPDSLPVGVGLRFLDLALTYKEKVDGLVGRDQAGTPTGPINELVLAQPHAGPRRVPYVQRCLFRCRVVAIETLLCNISRLGAYVTIDPLPDVGEEVTISFAAGGKPLELAAIVAWINPPERQAVDPLAPGCGVRFVALSAQDDERLKMLLEG